jgi:hypothetical protein
MLTFLDEFVSRLDATFTIYLPPDLPVIEVDGALRLLLETPDSINEIVRLATGSRTGSVIFWGESNKYLIQPPFPVKEKTTLRSLNAGKLHTSLSQNHFIGVVLVRLGSFAIGVFRGEQRLCSKVGTGLVHGRHRQGGSSAHRFERHRDKQIEYFMTRVCQHAREQLQPYIKTMEYIVYGGARTTILTLQKSCPLLGRLEIPNLPLLLDIPEPRQVVLEEAIKRVWTTTVYEYNPD